MAVMRVPPSRCTPLMPTFGSKLLYTRLQPVPGWCSPLQPLSHQKLVLVLVSFGVVDKTIFTVVGTVGLHRH